MIRGVLEHIYSPIKVAKHAGPGRALVALIVHTCRVLIRLPH